MNKNFLIIASLFGALSVISGAFAAHTLKEIWPADALAIFETGVRYQFYHVFALFIVAVLSEKFRDSLMNWSGYCFVIGIILFSGSLYTLAALKANGTLIPGAVGILTPVGGLFFIAGWLLLFFGIRKKN